MFSTVRRKTTLESSKFSILINKSQGTCFSLGSPGNAKMNSWKKIPEGEKVVFSFLETMRDGTPSIIIEIENIHPSFFIIIDNLFLEYRDEEEKSQMERSFSHSVFSIEKIKSVRYLNMTFEISDECDYNLDVESFDHEEFKQALIKRYKRLVEIYDIIVSEPPRRTIVYEKDFIE